MVICPQCHTPPICGLLIQSFYGYYVYFVDVLFLGRPHWVLFKEDFTSWLCKRISRGPRRQGTSAQYAAISAASVSRGAVVHLLVQGCSKPPSHLGRYSPVK